ncbi:MAG: tetratricopeptide repeat protein [Planctomycetota bacterium]|jgi:tetratricopeptide (TPR) repeat protein
MNPRTSDRARLRRRDFQFSIARLLVATTLCAVLLSIRLPSLLGMAGWVIIAGLVLSVLFHDWSTRHISRGSAALSVGDFPRALQAFSRAIEADPEDPSRYCWRAAAYQGQHDFEAARRDYATAIELDCRFAPAWIGRANLALAGHEFDRAVDDATVALCVAPAESSALMIRAYACCAAGNIEAALEDLSEVVRIAPEAGTAYFARATVHLAAEDFEAAQEDFDRAIRCSSGNGDAEVGRAIALFGQGDYETALEEVERHLEANPEAVDALAACAWFLATCPNDSLRDGGRALQLAEAALERSEGGHFSCESSLAAALAELGRFDEAVEHARRALELAPPVRRRRLEARLAVYEGQKPYRESDPR